jgi:hypothetical protein
MKIESITLNLDDGQTVVIPIGTFLQEVVPHMTEDNDLRFSVGMFFQEACWDVGWREVQQQMVKLFNAREGV